MPTVTVPQALAIILPIFVTFVSGVLTHQRLPVWANALIAGLVIAGASFGAALLNHAFGPDLVADFLIIAAYVAALMSSPVLAPLHQWLYLNAPSPLAALAPAKPAPIAPPAVPTLRASRADAPPLPAALRNRQPPEQGG